ncbi:antigen WC1.1-like [Patiria miniata]|uniref:SRCR domain-containing protein n=1 Tax=Patiria miniata TaxID=46514 RepID=A0A914B5D3_PATMI|nr:antigen WC1.1-like [Patiria miniata]
MVLVLRADGLLKFLLMATSVGLARCVSFGTSASNLVGYLGGGAARNEGWLQLYVDNQWVTVCNRNWTYDSADYTCRRLGFDGVRPDGWGVHLGEGTGPSWCLDGGDQGDWELVPCPVDGDDVCTHSDDVGLSCVWDPEPDDFLNRLGYMFRLTGPAVGQGEGRVEVFYGSEWGTVCSRGWTQYFADAVCKHLGYREGVQDDGWMLPAQEQGSGPVVCAEIFSLGLCPAAGGVEAAGEACTHSHDVGVRCRQEGDEEDGINSGRDMELVRLGIVAASSVLVAGGLFLPLLACYLMVKSPARRLSEDLENLIQAKEEETPPEGDGLEEVGVATEGEVNEGYTEEDERAGDGSLREEVKGQASDADKHEEEINSTTGEAEEASGDPGFDESTSGCKETSAAVTVNDVDDIETIGDNDTMEPHESAEMTQNAVNQQDKEGISQAEESPTLPAEERPQDSHDYEVLNEASTPENYEFSMHGEHALDSVYF